MQPCISTVPAATAQLTSLHLLWHTIQHWLCSNRYIRLRWKSHYTGVTCPPERVWKLVTKSNDRGSCLSGSHSQTFLTGLDWCRFLGAITKTFHNKRVLQQFRTALLKIEGLHETDLKNVWSKCNFCHATWCHLSLDTICLMNSRISKTPNPKFVTCLLYLLK